MFCKNERDVYVASCTKNGGIYHYKVCDGKLIFQEVTKMDRPMYMTIDNRKMYILLRTPFESQESGVVIYDIDGNGGIINPSPVFSTMGAVACHILVDRGDVYCANYISGSVAKLPNKVVQHFGHGADLNRQEKPHTHFVGMTPDQKYICVADLGTDTVVLYNRDLTVHSTVSVPSGHGVRHLAFSEDGKWMFSVNELQSTMSAFSYYDGALVLVDTCSIVPDSFVGESTAAAIRIKDGYVYASNRGHNSISKVSFSGERLMLLETIDCRGKAPRDFCFAGDYILCANQDSDRITVLDGKNGYDLVEQACVEQPICILAV